MRHIHINQRRAGTLLSYLYILISNTISLFYTPYMLRVMGKSEYGIYSAANSFISYLSILSFGISGAYIRFNVRARVREDRAEEKRLNGMFLAIFSVLSLLVLAGGIVMAACAGPLVKNTYTSEELLKLRVIIMILTFNMMETFICNVFMMALQAYEEFFFVRTVLLISCVVQPIVNIFLLQRGGRSIAITISAFAVGTVAYLVMFIYARHAIHFEVSFKGFKKKDFTELFVFSGYLFLNSVTNQITFSTDNIILSALRGTNAVAVYNVGANFKEYFLSFSSSISSVFSPQVNKIVAGNDSMSKLDDLFIKIGRIQFMIVSLILIGYLSIGYRFVCIWAGEDYSDSYMIGLLLMLAVFVPSFQNVGIEIQQAMNKHKARSIVYFLVALINIAITIPFSKMWGGIGAALATMICMWAGTVFFMNWYYAKHIGLDIKRFWKSIFSMLPGMVAPACVGFAINRFVDIRSYLGVLCAALAITLIYAVSVWKFSINNYEKTLMAKPIEQLIGKGFRN